MEVFQHLLGACGDNHSHLDLTDLALMGGGGAMGMYAIRYYALSFYFLIKSYTKK